MKILIPIIIPLFVLSTNRPIFHVHGFRDSCADIQKRVPGDWHCIETGAKFFGSIKNIYNQAKIGCKQLEKRMFDILKNEYKVKQEYEHGIHLVGWSQGGLITRLIFQSCARVRPFVKRLYSIGTPHLGIDEIPKSKPKPNKQLDLGDRAVNSIIAKIERNVAASSQEQNYSALQYLNKPGSLALFIKSMLENNVSLSINVKEKNIGRYDKVSKPYDNLEFMMNIAFFRDEMIKPMSSMIFGLEFDPVNKSFSDLNEKFSSAELTEELGLKELYNRGRMWNCVADNPHVELGIFSMFEFSNTLNTWCSEKAIEEMTAEEIKSTHEFCLNRVLNSMTSIELICDRGKKEHPWNIPREDYLIWSKDKLF